MVVPEILMPTNEELQGLYDVAMEYKAISVEASNMYDKLVKKLRSIDKASQDKDLKLLLDKQLKLEKQMNSRRHEINKKFPDLNLPCPAPFASLDESLSTYKDIVLSCLFKYVKAQWAAENRIFVKNLSSMISRIKPVKSFEVGMFLYTHPGQIYEVLKITHKGKRVFAKNVSNTRQIASHKVDPAARDYKLLTKKFMSTLLKYEECYQRTLKKYGVDNVI